MPSLTKQEKKEQLDEILADLENLKAGGRCENPYALEENIKFFRALYSFPKFVRWFFKERPKIDGSRLLELSDFHLHGGKWEKILQRDLLEIEQWKFPDLLKPIRTSLLGLITPVAGSSTLVIVNVGCGSMEVERQTVRELKAMGELDTRRIIFMGIDESAESLRTAERNLSSSGMSVSRLTALSPDVLQSLKSEDSQNGPRFFLYNGKALDLQKYFSDQSVDILFHSKFKHHLSRDAKCAFDAAAESAAHNVIEYDNLNGWFMLVVPIRSQWLQPVLMNGAMFSCLRDPKRGEIENTAERCYEYKYWVDSYVRLYNSDKESVSPVMRRIIKAAVLAPSGENSQPWQFRLAGPNVLHLINMPDRDRSLYNVSQLASFLAHGAAYENLRIAATCFGYETEISLFPEKQNPNLVGIIKLKKNNNVKPETEKYVCIEKRGTNRRPFSKSLEKNWVAGLENAYAASDGFKFYAVTGEESVGKISETVSVAEKILLENKSIHDFFFDHVTWSEKEDEKKRAGFYVKTLELPAVARLMFRVVRSWDRLAKMNKTGAVSRKVMQANSKVYASSAFMVALAVREVTPEIFFKLGQRFENIWLEATRLGLFIQPLTGVLFLNLQADRYKDAPISSEHRVILRDAYKRLSDIFKIGVGERIAVIFRAGKAEQPSALSRRYTLDSFIK